MCLYREGVAIHAYLTKKGGLYKASSCPRLSAFACLSTSAFVNFVCVCLRLLELAYAPLRRALPLHASDSLGNRQIKKFKPL